MAKELTFQVRLDAGTGLFQLEVQKGLWSVPLELSRIERIVKQEALRRASEGAPPEGKLLSASVILAEALLNAPAVRRIPAKGNRAQAAEIEAAELDAILGLGG